MSRFFPAITLCGARQTGKTTLIKKAFPEYNYVSLDLPSTAAMAEHNPDDYFEKYPPPLIIDEVQYAPAVFRHIKRFIDQDRHRMGQFILTGSQKFNLMKEVSDSLAGRTAKLDLETLSRDEIRKPWKMSLNRDLLTKLITRGEFPESWRIPDFQEISSYSSYLSTNLERDVRQFLNVASLRDFKPFIRALAPRSGNILNKSDLARDVGVSVKAVNDWISVLQASNQIVLLEPWFQNISKRMAKSPKIYFCDSGLICFLLGVTKDNLSASPFKGQVWEALVFAELRKINHTLKSPRQFWFYRDQAAREIDFIIEKGGYLSFAECKWTEAPDKDDCKTITEVHRELEKKKGPYQGGSHFLICNVKDSYSVTSGIKAVNLDTLSKLLN